MTIIKPYVEANTVISAYLLVTTKSRFFLCDMSYIFLFSPQNLSSSQSWELFQLYLQQEYRGSSSELMSALSSYRSESRLLHHIYSFHLTDPLHLLSCRTHLLASAARKSHPYQVGFGRLL